MGKENYYEKYGITPPSDTGNKDSFSAALSDFTHDVASGDAIRHLADHGYTVSQIAKRLDYPTPRERIIKTFTRYLTDKGILTSHPPEDAIILELDKAALELPSEKLEQLIRLHGSENIYVRLTTPATKKVTGYLNTDDEDYLASINTAQGGLFHILNERLVKLLSSI
ncbi:MAG: hypothetical protein IKO61_11175 [Lachnospiraceae bacterium]|nr:hypothetical protein [Lachnospiraceae bacterium]